MTTTSEPTSAETNISCSETSKEKSKTWEQRLSEHKRDITLVVLSVLVAIGATLLVEIIKSVLNLINLPSLLQSIGLTGKFWPDFTTLIIYVVLVIVIVVLVRRQINIIALINDIKNYTFKGNFAGRTIPQKLNCVKKLYKDINALCQTKYETKIVSLKLTDVPVSSKSNNQEKENLFMQKTGSLSELGISVLTKDKKQVATIIINVKRAEDKITFFCLCDCGEDGTTFKKELKNHLDRDGKNATHTLESFDDNL